MQIACIPQASKRWKDKKMKALFIQTMGYLSFLDFTSHLTFILSGFNFSG